MSGEERSRERIQALADRLWEAETTTRPVPPLTEAEPPLRPEDAYAVQLAVADMRRGAGHRVVGKKIGLTSAAMQQLIGVDEPDYGHLFDVMSVADGGTIRRAELIAPKVEPEIAFVLAAPLPGRATTPEDVLRCTASIHPALEVVDSRVRDWRIRWADTVADNGSSARFVLGESAVEPRDLDLTALEVVLSRNCRAEASGTMDAVLGGPVLSICWLAHKLEEFDIALAEGDVILPGSPCKALDAGSGDTFHASFAGLGSVAVSFA
ncbi:2-keto-4-pentenoate hydratase [Micromonospora inositola]|uniref:2-keto-4-pentenoate hydratase n=1 Tax=Micromonospora inositola TaxID=47865 RepID=A0A1C5K5N6_9ACTN|nr:fumarylacetoacetate hydrolase family protein [Micromonospora inositola]SCG77911.1 2-keto-4-pentenoate hydratase [Micromonospora inositola]